MKKIFPLLLAALFAVQAKSQITFNRSDWTKVVGDDTELYRAVDPYAVPLPSEGPNQIWDYSGVAFNTGTTYYLDYDSVSFPPIPAATMQRNIQSASPIPLVPFLAAKRYFKIDNNSFSELGGNLLPITLPLQTVTGGPNDQLEFTGNLNTYTDNLLQFPFTFGDTWNSSFQFSSNFNLTVAAFGLNNVPGSNDQDININYSVSGYGTLRLPNLSGGPVIEHQALLIREDYHVVNTYTLGGAPAPPPLLAAFGLTQGSVTQGSNYSFWVKGLEDYSMYFNNVGSASTFSVSILQNQSPVASIPTMSEWGLLLFALIILSLGLAAVVQPEYRMAMAGLPVTLPAGKFSLSSMPFDRQTYLQALKYAVGLGLLGFVFIRIAWGEIVAADLVCMPFAVMLVAYQIHLVMLFKEK